jgi:hypothetical protein
LQPLRGGVMNAAMRRKDFELIAAALRCALPAAVGPVEYTSMQRDMHRRCCDAVAHALRQQYPAFDRERFLRDCGVQP